MVNDYQKQNLLASYADEGEIFLKSLDNLEISKGRKAEALGTKKNYGGKDYIKTANGWKPVGKHSGAAKAAHDYVHGGGNKEEKLSDRAQELYDKTMSLYKNNPSKQQDYLDKLKQIVAPNSQFDDDHKSAATKMLSKIGNKKANPSDEKDHYQKWDDAHGIEVGKEYNHDYHGKVTVTKVDKNTGDKSDKISHHVTFKTDSGSVDTQGINGFKASTSSKDADGKSFSQKEIEKEQDNKLKTVDDFKKEISTVKQLQNLIRSIRSLMLKCPVF